MSTQSERVSHDRAVSFSSRAYHIHIHKDMNYYYVQKKKKETCHVGKYLYYLFLLFFDNIDIEIYFFNNLLICEFLKTFI